MLGTSDRWRLPVESVLAASGTRWNQPLSPAGTNPYSRMRSAMKRAARSPPGVAVPRPCMLSSARAETRDSTAAESIVADLEATGVVW